MAFLFHRKGHSVLQGCNPSPRSPPPISFSLPMEQFYSQFSKNIFLHGTPPRYHMSLIPHISDKNFQFMEILSLPQSYFRTFFSVKNTYWVSLFLLIWNIRCHNWIKILTVTFSLQLLQSFGLNIIRMNTIVDLYLKTAIFHR